MLRVAKNSRWVGIQKRNRGSGIEATWNRFWNRESGIGVPWKSKWNRESGIEATWKPKRNRGSGSQVVLGIGVPFLTWFRNRLSDPGPVLRNSELYACTSHHKIVEKLKVYVFWRAYSSSGWVSHSKIQFTYFKDIENFVLKSMDSQLSNAVSDVLIRFLDDFLQLYL